MVCRVSFNLEWTKKKLLLLAAFFFGLQNFLSAPSSWNRKDYIAPPIEIKYLSTGFSVQLADSFWLRAIQDMDYCDQALNERECVGKSWLFDVINLTVELDNKFKEAYYYGALALTVLVNDFDGASIIFDKGTKNFNKDWRLLYAAGYHALFEEKNKLKASKLYLAAVENGAPDWVRLMAGRLASEGGNNLLASEILQDLVKLESDPIWIDKLRKKIEKFERSK